MMPPAEQDQIGQGRRSAAGPMLDVVSLPDARLTPWEPAGAVPVEEGTADGGRNRSRPCADLYQSTVLIVAHHDPARIAREAL